MSLLLKYGRQLSWFIYFSVWKWPPPKKTIKKPILPLTTSLQKKCTKKHSESKESPTLKDRKTHVQLGCCGPHAIELAMKFSAAVCYFASSCLCKIGWEIWQLMKTVQQNKRLAKNISKVGFKKTVKAGCMQNVQLSLPRHSYSAISWIPMRFQTQTEREIIYGLCDKLYRNQLNFKSLISLFLSISAKVPSLWNKCGLHYLIRLMLAILMPSLI